MGNTFTYKVPQGRGRGLAQPPSARFATKGYKALFFFSFCFFFLPPDMDPHHPTHAFCPEKSCCGLNFIINRSAVLVGFKFFYSERPPSMKPNSSLLSLFIPPPPLILLIPKREKKALALYTKLSLPLSECPVPDDQRSLNEKKNDISPHRE